jgi:hypothetical protein
MVSDAHLGPVGRGATLSVRCRVDGSAGGDGLARMKSTDDFTLALGYKQILLLPGHTVV